MLSVYSAENSVKKMYIDDGVLSFCYSPEASNAAVILYVMDIKTKDVNKHYLPGSIFVPGGGRKSPADPVRFPLSWSVFNNKFQIIFPNLLSDAIGRISFRMWSAENITDLSALKTIRGFVDESKIIRYNGYWHGESILFMNSAPFLTDSITNENNHIWYEIDHENLLARIPGQESLKDEWGLLKSPKRYKWFFYSIETKLLLAAADEDHSDFTPLIAVKPNGKKILCNDGSSMTFKNADWVIWGVDRHNNPKILKIFFSKEVRFELSDCSHIPRLVLCNNDSNYILLYYNEILTALNIEESMNNIVDYLRGENLLKKYSGRPAVNQSRRTKNIFSESPKQRGIFDPLSPEEMERRKREFLDSQPRKELFSENELKELFTEPDYTRITDLLQLARAYDWFGKYPEALAALKSAEGMAAKFELGYFLKHGRPGVSPDMEKANRLFAEIVSAIEKMGGLPSPEDYCLAGRASSEYTPENWDEKDRWKRRAASFFQKAISEGYRPAYFYSQYYLRHSSDNDPQKLLKVLPSDNLEINAFIGALAGLNPRFKTQRNRDKNLEAVKAAIHAHSNLAQAMLGMLYLHSKTDPNAFLRHNPRKAKFWLQRAADRGDTDALQILNSDSRLKDPKRSKP